MAEGKCAPIGPKRAKKKCVPITFLKTAVRRLEEILTGVEKTWIRRNGLLVQQYVVL